jgi:hypothetical protein
MSTSTTAKAMNREHDVIISIEDAFKIIELNQENGMRKLMPNPSAKILPGKPSKNGHKWTEIEDLCLRCCYRIAPLEKILARLNRTPDAIRRRFYDMEYHLTPEPSFKYKKGEKTPRGGYIWTEEEIKYLNATFGILTRDQHQKRLDRSARSIEEKGNKLGFNPGKWGDYGAGLSAYRQETLNKLKKEFMDKYGLNKEQIDDLFNKVIAREYDLI